VELAKPGLPRILEDSLEKGWRLEGKEIPGFLKPKELVERKFLRPQFNWATQG